MSADNYYTVKFNSEDLKWYSIMGFMSTLEDGVPALVREGHEGFDTYEDAEAAAGSDWSEYGVIVEDVELRDIVTREQFEVYARNRIETLRWYLGEGDEDA